MAGPCGRRCRRQRRGGIGAARRLRATMRTLATLMLAVLPGCMAPTLWPVRGEVLDLSERHEQRFTVTAAGVQVDDLHDYDGPPTSSLLVEAKRLAGSCVYLLDTVVRDTSW